MSCRSRRSSGRERNGCPAVRSRAGGPLSRTHWATPLLIGLLCVPLVLWFAPRTGAGARRTNGEPVAIKALTLASTSNLILGFDQDGRRLATFERARKSCPRASVVFRAADGRRISRIRVDCDVPQLFSLGGKRASWREELQGINSYDQLHSVDADGRRSRYEDLIREPSGGGRTLSDIAADGSFSFYGELWWNDCAEVNPCQSVVSGGLVGRIGEPAQTVSDLPPAGALAVSGPRIAISPPVLKTDARNSGPSWSPDGSAIAYGTRSLGLDWEVVVAAPGSAPKPVTHNWVHDSSPDWSPDGSRLVYESESRTGLHSRPMRIVISDADGGNPHPIATGLHPVWSPSGDRIAFAKEEGGVWLVNADGTGEKMLAEATVWPTPAWSPDASELAFESSAGLVVMRADGSGQPRVVAQGRAPTWSPDGRQIAYEALTATDEELRVVGSNGSGDRALTDNAVNDYSPDWSPDGTRIAFVREARGVSELYSVSPQGGSEMRLTTTRARRYRSPVEIRRHDGGMVSRFLPTAHPDDVALSRYVAATLSRGKRSARLELFDTRSGRRLGTASLPRRAASVSISGSAVVFVSGRQIWALDVRTRKPRLVTRATADPIGLSIEGNRIAWAENLRRSSRIRAVFLRK